MMNKLSISNPLTDIENFIFLFERKKSQLLSNCMSHVDAMTNKVGGGNRLLQESCSEILLHYTVYIHQSTKHVLLGLFTITTGISNKSRIFNAQISRNLPLKH